MDLYRVGVPSIGEVYKARFTWNRGTGGIGTGVYAFRDEWAATSNISNSSPDKQLYVLDDILSNPIQPSTLDATMDLHRLSTFMSYLSVRDASGEYSYEEALENADSLRGSKPTGWGEGGFGSGESLGSLAFTILLQTPQLRDSYGLDEEAFLRAFIEATREAGRMLDTGPPRSTVQPVNVLLYPEFDGVAPLEGAGGDTGKWGCVVFKQVIDQMVGRTTTTGEKVPGVL
jgi:hypothetical protein